MDSPHDKLFKIVFRDVSEAEPLLRSILPKEVQTTLDWSSLKVVEGSFVDKALRERRTDILYSVNAKDGPVYLAYVLLEHQSTVQAMMAFRMYEYVTLILAQWRRKHPKAKALPQVLPIVLYAGREPWDAETSVENLVDGPTSAWTPKMSFLLEDLSQVSDQAISDKTLRVFGEIALRALLRLPTSTNPAADLMRWLPLLQAMLKAPNGVERLRYLIEYLAAVAEVVPDALQPVMRRLGPAAEETVMTLAEQLRQEGLKLGLERGIERGIEQGIERGIEQGIKKGQREARIQLLLRLLTTKFQELPPAVVARVEAGNNVDFERWAERVLLADTLDEVFDRY